MIFSWLSWLAVLLVCANNGPGSGGGVREDGCHILQIIGCQRHAAFSLQAGSLDWVLRTGEARKSEPARKLLIFEFRPLRGVKSAFHMSDDLITRKQIISSLHEIIFILEHCERKMKVASQQKHTKYFEIHRISTVLNY